MSTPVFHRLEIADVRPETPEAVSVAFVVPASLREAYRYAPGQYLTLRATLDGEEVRRSYSICSGLDDGELRIVIKRLEGGVFSSWANVALQAGDAIDVMTPMGRFGIADAKDLRGAKTYVAFAAGSGITPVLSILKTVLARAPDSRFFLFYGNRTSESIIFREQLNDLKDRFVARFSVFHMLSREQQDLASLSGRLEPARIKILLPLLVPLVSIDQVFVCGPLAMIDGVETSLVDLGVARSVIQIERFTPAPWGPATRPRPTPVVGEMPRAEITAIVGGLRKEFSLYGDDALIDAAAHAGIDLPYSCKGGMCCTCRAKVLEGAVEMATNYSLEPWETAAGFVLTCQSRPTTARVVVDYDQV